MYPTRPFKYPLTSSMVKGEAYKAADAMLIDCGDGVFGVEVITEKSREAFKGSAARAATPEMVQKIEAMKHAVPDEAALPMDRDAVCSYLVGKEHHEVWEKRGKKCFSCGSCVMVCPTCYCFDVQDELDLSLEKGERVRSWDGCTIENFATAAGGIISGKRPRTEYATGSTESKSSCTNVSACRMRGVRAMQEGLRTRHSVPVDIIAEMKEKEA